MVLQVLKENQLFAKYRKCVFLLSLDAFLGYIISSEGVEVDPRKTEPVKNWPRPLTPTDIRSFFVLASYYRRFFNGFASIVFPLNTLTQNSKKFEWSKACERSFQILKDTFTSTLMLTLPEGTNGFVLYCGASKLGLGCLLIQHGKVVAYASTQLKVHELKLFNS